MRPHNHRPSLSSAFDTGPFASSRRTEHPAFAHTGNSHCQQVLDRVRLLQQRNSERSFSCPQPCFFRVVWHSFFCSCCCPAVFSGDAAGDIMTMYSYGSLVGYKGKYFCKKVFKDEVATPLQEQESSLILFRCPICCNSSQPKSMPLH